MASVTDNAQRVQTRWRPQCKGCLPKTHVHISKRGMNAISLARGLVSVAPSRNAPGRLRIAFQPSGLGGPAGRRHVLAVGFQRTEVEGRKGFGIARSKASGWGGYIFVAAFGGFGRLSAPETWITRSHLVQLIKIYQMPPYRSSIAL